MSVIRSTFWSVAVGLLAALLGPCASSGCGGAMGGAEAGNPSLTVVGSVSNPEGGCEADRVFATDSRDREFDTNVDQDCSFELSLPASEAYRLDLLRSGVTVASMEFENAPGRFSSPVMNLPPNDDTVFLDRISIDGETVSPSRQPSEQTDQDGDGLHDFADKDDDGDGVSDEDERDCDLDGAIDDFDGDDSSCVPSAEPAFVLEVSPRNNEGLSGKNLKVKTTGEIRLRFSCAVDLDTLAGGLEVFPETDPANPLLCAFELTGSGKQARCTHPELLSDTVYRARLEGARCEDGSRISAVTWSWRTRSSP